MLVSPAFAQDGGGGLGGIEPLIPLVLIFVVFYFLLIRPQQKKAKAHRQMIGDLRRGDRIVTAGGLVGQIHRVAGDSELLVEIADGVRVRVVRSTVAELRAKPEPRRVRDDDEDEDDADDDGREERGRRGRRKAAARAAAEDDGEPDDDPGDEDREEESPRRRHS